MRGRGKSKLTAALIAATGAAILAVGALPAAAGAAPNPGPPINPNPDGPQTANIPYLAWVGEHVRLVVCDPAISAGSGEVSSLQFANYQIEDWSGYQFQPPSPDGDLGNNLFEAFDPGPAAFFGSSEPAHEGDGCVSTDYKSLNPGLARIRVVVRNFETKAIVFSHQFIVIWLTANQPTLQETGASATGSEIFQTQLNTTGKANLSRYLGDPSGDGEFTPTPFTPAPGSNEDKGLLQVKVTGSFPVVKESPLSNVLGESSYTLPGAWATLADTLASSSEETEPPGSDPALWDIHGTPSEATTPNEASTTNDPLHDEFLRPAFADLTSGLTATVGPFDPQAANETLLSDGVLNEDDAPMPAMRIDVAIAANKGGTDIGGAGQIEEASKAMIYSHDFTGNAEEKGNLYNPYYGSYIPATDRPVAEASGTDGPSPGGDFPGFLNDHSEPYAFWTTLDPRDERVSHPTGCLRREGMRPADYESPSGPLTESVYTDERGEAYVSYEPGNQFYLEDLLSTIEESDKIIKNNDGGCDLKGVRGEVIGESSITAKAVYPYEPVDFPTAGATLTSTAVVKKVRSLWEKEFFEFPKGPGENERSRRIIVAKAQDIDGSPIVGEAVCFLAPNGGVVAHFSGNEVDDEQGVLGFGIGEVNVGPSTIVSPPDRQGQLCEETNENGLVAIEVINSTLNEVDLNVEYVEENILRDHPVVFVAPSAPPSTAPNTNLLTTTPTGTAGGVPSVIAPPTPAPGVSGGAAPARITATPLTLKQRLHQALDACKAKPRKTRARCEAQARKAFSGQPKKAASKNSKGAPAAKGSGGR